MKNLFTALFALLLPVLATAQLSISGKVTDQTGAPLPGATVTINPANTTVSDGNGKYQLSNVPNGNYTLKVTYIGYQPFEKAVVLTANTVLNISLNNSTTLTEEITVSATRASNNSPTAFTNLSKKDIDKNNSGRGFEYLLEQTPSTVVTSNAGAGVGYTSIRIRGSDATRTNVTLNGIPINDAEDQGVYFVDLPDMASSVDNIQVQRGVGTSTNGAGAFGASINIQTTTRHDTAYAELNNSTGSYGTVKNTVAVGTGLLGGHFSFDGRLSRMNSDGYIDRAFSHLKSYFLTGAYYGKNSVLRLNVFSGYEQTYQAWDGVPEDSVKAGNRTYNELGNIHPPSNIFYKNQTDNYTQNYYQLLYNQQISSKLSFSGALHYTKGYGYYEEYRNSDSLKNYNVTPVVIGGTSIETTDLVRDLWLSNDFYGITYNLNYKPNNDLGLILGGAYNEYKGAHYNNIVWTQESTNIPPDYEYSRNDATKKDFNIFGRAEYHLGDVLLYGDMQYRHIYYSFLGFDENLRNVQQQVELNFFNPKAGVTWLINSNSNVYASLAFGNHEPNRSDYTNSSPESRPKPENLKDLELGYRYTNSDFSGSINGFYMLYKNQLVLTGALDDVGEAIRTNIKDSYRAGIEASARVKIAQQLSWFVNATLSTNKVKDFEQYLADESGTLIGTQYKRTNIAYSPDFTGSSTISYHPVKNAEIVFITKYVSRQYLDNTSTQSRSLDGYLVNDVRLNYNFRIIGIKNVGVGLLVNNIFSKKYQSDGATYPDIEGGKVVNYNYFFPQAPINFLASLNLRFLMDLNHWIQLFLEQVKETTFWEWAAVLFSMAEVLLAKVNNIWLYPTGIAGTFIGIYILMIAGLYAESALNVYYLVMSIYGWVHWIKRRNEPPVKITWTTRREWIITLIIVFAGWVILYVLLKDFTTSNVPVWDAWVSSTAWAGMWLLARRKLENWILLNISNLFAIPLLCYKHLVLFSVLTLFLFIVAFFGFFDWLAIWKKEKASPQPLSNGEGLEKVSY